MHEANLSLNMRPGGSADQTQRLKYVGALMRQDMMVIFFHSAVIVAEISTEYASSYAPEIEGSRVVTRKFGQMFQTYR